MSCDLQSAEAVFSYSSHSVLNTAVVGVALVVVGVVFFKNKVPSTGQGFLSGRIAGLGLLMVFFGVLVLGIAAPNKHFDRIVLNPKGVCSSNRLWVSSLPADRFYYSDVEYVLRKRDDKGLYELEVHFKDGRANPVRRTDLWAENEEKIMQVLRNHGVALRE